MRHEFSRKTKRAAWERCGGRCEGIVRNSGPFDRGLAQCDREYRCNAPLENDAFVYDHIDPDWFSGCNDLSNCQVLCEQCDKAKTGNDQGDIAKVKRVRDKRIKALTSKRPLPGGRNDWRKRKIGGGVVDRRTGKRLYP